MINTSDDCSIALITGANRGIGLEVARQLGQAGHRVILAVRNHERGKSACADLEASGVQAEVELLDVTDMDSIAAAARQVEQRHDRLDILVNNAGILLEEVTRESKSSGVKLHYPLPSEVDMNVVYDTFMTNSLAPIAVTKAFLPLLRRSQAASIVNVTSWLGSLSLADRVCQGSGERYINLLAYNVSKAALNAATLQFAIELRSTCIRVNAVNPGHCATGINGYSGDRSPAEAAKIIVDVATQGPDGPNGSSISHGQESW